MPGEDDIRAIEMALLVEGLYRVHGLDFRDYAEASLRRRLSQWLQQSPFESFGAALSGLLRSPELCAGLIDSVSVNVSDMFRDPPFYACLRETALPHLGTYPLAKIWVAGCATGEELYSVAILLHEQGLSERCRIYATDLSQAALEQARRGVFPLKQMRQFTRNYQLAGGRAAFSDYYVARYEHAIIDPGLLRSVVFASHNLATDADFSEMQLILCRNVMIYFKPALKTRVLRLFDHCLSLGGFLGLGAKETLEGQSLAPRYREVAPRQRLYRKTYPAAADE